MTEPRITSDGFTAAQADEVLALVEAARLADGVAPLSEHGMLRLRYDGSDGGRDFIVMTGGEIVGYAYLDPPSGGGEGEVTGELVIHPDRRRQLPIHLHRRLPGIPEQHQNMPVLQILRARADNITCRNVEAN